MTIFEYLNLDEADARAQSEERQGWQLDGLMQAGRLTLVVGKGYTGKSRLAALVATAAARGMPLGSRSVLPGKTLWIGLEHSQTEILGNFRAAARGLGIEPWPSDSIQLLAPRTFSLDDEQHVEAVVQHADQHAIDLIVIDPLVAAHANDETPGREMRHVMNAARKLTSGGKRTVVVLHHPGKRDASARGSGDLEASADSVVYLTTDKPGTNGPITVEAKHHSHGPGSWRIQFAYDEHGAMRLIERDDEAGAPLANGHDRSRELEAKIVEVLLEEIKPITQTKLRKAVGGNAKDFREALGAVLMGGTVTETPGPHKQAKFYKLASNAEHAHVQ